jgi:hypothetical protein
MLSEAPFEWDYFLAYAKSDKEKALELYRHLESRFLVFMDQERILPGARWDKCISQALAASRNIVFLLSEESDASWYLGDEIARAVELLRESPTLHRIVPVLLAEGKPLRLPYGLQHLSPIDALAVGGMAGVARRLMDLRRSDRRPPVPSAAFEAEVPSPSIPARPLLFGRDLEIDSVMNSLVDRASPQSMIALDGLGGIGKTALAAHVAERIRETGFFHRVVWVTAKMEEHDGSRTVRREGAAVSMPYILAVLATQYGFAQELEAASTLADKAFLVRRHLRPEPCLLVVDNLETVGNYRYLLADLQGLLEESRAILTSRVSLLDHSAVRSFTLPGLPLEASVQLLRHELSTRSPGEAADIDDASLESIHAATGGLPLAMKLIVGRLLSTAQPLDRLLRNLINVDWSDQGSVFQEFYRFIYWDSWGRLSEEARDLLAAMTMIPPLQASPVDLIQRISRQDEETFYAAMEELLGASLLERSGGLANRSYSLHPITHHFIQHLEQLESL